MSEAGKEVRRRQEQRAEFLLALSLCLEAHPTQRIGQLLTNAVGGDILPELDIFHVPDEDLTKALTEYIREPMEVFTKEAKSE
jgi:hypothetical protein